MQLRNGKLVPERPSPPKFYTTTTGPYSLGSFWWWMVRELESSLRKAYRQPTIPLKNKELAFRLTMMMSDVLVRLKDVSPRDLHVFTSSSQCILNILNQVHREIIPWENDLKDVLSTITSMTHRVVAHNTALPHMCVGRQFIY